MRFTCARTAQRRFRMQKLNESQKSPKYMCHPIYTIMYIAVDLYSTILQPTFRMILGPSAPSLSWHPSPFGKVHRGGIAVSPSCALLGRHARTGAFSHCWAAGLSEPGVKCSRAVGQGGEDRDICGALVTQLWIPMNVLGSEVMIISPKKSA